MKLHAFFRIIPILLIVSGCNSHEKKKYDDDKELQYEIQVLNNIFVELTKGMNVSYGYPKHPPPPPAVRNSNGKIISYDSTKYISQIAKYHLDTTNFIIHPKSILLAISDSLFQFSIEDVPKRKNWPSKSYASVVNSIRWSQKPKRKIPINRIQRTGYFHLQYSSRYKKTEDDLSSYYYNLNKNGVHGMLRLSRIHFNKKKDRGILKCGYYISGHNAQGADAYIKKENGKWLIVKLRFTWIS